MTATPTPSSRQRLIPVVMLGVLTPFSLIDLWSILWWGTHLPQDLNHGLAPWRISDFAMFFASGHLAASSGPGRVYTRHLLLTWEYRHVLGYHHVDPFVYPPPTLLLTRLIGWLGYWRAYGVWTIGLTGLSVGILRFGRLPWKVIIVAILSPAALFTLMLGQLSILSGSCFVTSLLIVDSTPYAAGIFSALTIFKPQTALLAPLAILARRRWRAIAAGLATVAALCLLTELVFGTGIWTDYVIHGLSSSRNLLDLPYPRPAFGTQYRGGFEYDEISVFFMLRSFGLSTDVAMAVQIISAVIAIIACWRLWRRNDADPVVRAVITIFLGLLVTPYGFTQDMVAFSLAIILMVWRRGTLETEDIVLLLWPALLGPVSNLLDHSITPLLVLWAAYRAFGMLQPVSQKEPVTAALS